MQLPMLPCGMGPQTALHHAAVHHPTIPIATRSRVCKADEPTIGRAGSRRALLLAFSFLAFLSFLPALSLLATITVSPLGVALPRTAVPFVAILPRLPALARSLSPILQCNRRSDILLLPLARGGAKVKPKLRAEAKTKAAHKAKAAERGPPPAPSAVQLDPLLEAAYQLYLQGRSHNQSRVSRNAWLRNTTSGTIVKCEPSGTGESVSATPRRQPPPPPKAPPRDQHEATDAAQGGGPPSPTGDSYESSTEAAEEANPARSGTPTPWARRTARKTTAARSAALPAAQHVSQAPVAPEAWEPDAMEAGSLSPPLSEWEWPSTPRGPNQGDFASLSEVAAAPPLCSPGWPGGSSHGS